MSTQTLVREDWDDISKLTFRDAEGHEIVEVKILESFIGVKPYPVVVVMRTLTNDLIARQYNIEGKAEKMVDDFQIVKVPEPEPVNYEEIVKELMIKGVFVSERKKNWSKVQVINESIGQFAYMNNWYNLEGIGNFYFSFDLENFFDFETYLTLRGKS